MFTAAEREDVRSRLLEHARADDRVTAAAITGSFAEGTEDAWSDIDLGFGIANGVELAPVIASWTELLDTEFGALHHWDLNFGLTTFRVFLLSSSLEVDLAFTQQDQFRSYGPAFRSVFGTHLEHERPAPNANDITGLAWHNVLHSRACIERGKPWQTELWISGIRDHVIELASIRLGLPSAYGRSADRLPDELKASLEPTLVQSIDPSELRRALRAATEALLAEVRETDAELSARLAEVLLEV